MSTDAKCHDVTYSQRRLADVDRQIVRLRRTEDVRLRQRATLLHLIAEAMAEFDISRSEVMAARRLVGEPGRRGRSSAFELDDALGLQDGSDDGHDQH
ncbi:hypothetical protein GCM10023144_02010 [Pigmentiphaga soli]|uniref:Uncharacterized protein n=1 Tax=Pigmentiphaga soli TaxID=1007095 RepID=A0ABP8GDA0_9BURK